jgi:NADPH:quinone reductase-like Zn-dependent oxidoreductase
MKSALSCLGPAEGGRLVVVQQSHVDPKPKEIGVDVAAAAVNPIDVLRANGYGRRLLSLIGAGKFPLTLGNDFAGTVYAVGSQVGGFKTGDRVYGVKPASANGTHASQVTVKAAHALHAPAGSGFEQLAVLPYCFVTMWLAVRGAGLSTQNAHGKKVLVHGAAGGLGRLALQMLSHWGAEVTAIAWPQDFQACRLVGAVATIDGAQSPFSELAGQFDATLNFASWDDDAALLKCLREQALGHATTVHPMLRNIDEGGFVGGILRTIKGKKRQRALLPKGVKNYVWVTFRPDPGALAELERLAKNQSISLPVGQRAPLENGKEAFDHVRGRGAGRALILP